MTHIHHVRNHHENFKANHECRHYNQDPRDIQVFGGSSSRSSFVGDALLAVGIGVTAYGIGNTKGDNLGQKTGNYFKNFIDQSGKNLKALFGSKTKTPAKLDTPVVGLTTPPAVTLPTKMPASLTGAQVAPKSAGTTPIVQPDVASTLIKSASTTMNNLIASAPAAAPVATPASAAKPAPAATAAANAFNMFAAPSTTAAAPTDAASSVLAAFTPSISSLTAPAATAPAATIAAAPAAATSAPSPVATVTPTATIAAAPAAPAPTPTPAPATTTVSPTTATLIKATENQMSQSESKHQTLDESADAARALLDSAPDGYNGRITITKTTVNGVTTTHTTAAQYK